MRERNQSKAKCAAAASSTYIYEFEKDREIEIKYDPLLSVYFYLICFPPTQESTHSHPFASYLNAQ